MFRFTAILVTLIVAAVAVPVALGFTSNLPTQDPVQVEFAGQYYRRWLDVANVFCANGEVDFRGMTMEWYMPDHSGTYSYTRYLNGVMISGQMDDVRGSRVFRADATDLVTDAVYPFTYKVVYDSYVGEMKTYSSAISVTCTRAGQAAAFELTNTPYGPAPAMVAAP